MERTPAHFLHGIEGPFVLVPAKVCAYLERFAKLDDFRRSSRGANPEADMILDALHAAAIAWRSSDSGTSGAGLPELRRRWFSTAEAANQLGITDRGIRKAIQIGQLPAKLSGGRWLIDRDDLAKYRRRDR